MLEEILAAGWEFGKPLLQAGFQRAGEQGAPGPYLQAPGVRQEAAASLYGAPQPGGGLDPRQGGDSGQQLQAAKFIIDSALSLSDKFSQKPEGGQTKGDYAKTMGVTVYGPEQADATGQRYAMGFHPEGAQRKRYLNVGEFVDKHGRLDSRREPLAQALAPARLRGARQRPSPQHLPHPHQVASLHRWTRASTCRGPHPWRSCLAQASYLGHPPGYRRLEGLATSTADFDALTGTWQERFDGPTGMGTALSGMGHGVMMPDYPSTIGADIRASRSDKTTYARAWDLCTMFLEGRQWLDYNRDNKQFVIDLRSRPDGSQRQTINLLLNIYRNIMARLTLAYPSIAVLPASPSNSDIIKAKSSETALRYYWSREDIEKKLHKGLQWMLVTGTTAMHSYYDADEDVIHTEPISPYDLIFEDKVTDPEESLWVAIRSFHVEQDVKDAYPEQADEISATQSDSDDNGLDADLHTIPEDRVELIEVYWRDGRHAILAGDVYLYKGTWKTKSFPIQVIRYTEVPGRLWGIGLMQPLLDLQRLYNEQRTQVVHNVKLMGNPKWAIPKTRRHQHLGHDQPPGRKGLLQPGRRSATADSAGPRCQATCSTASPGHRPRCTTSPASTQSAWVSAPLASAVVAPWRCSPRETPRSFKRPSSTSSAPSERWPRSSWSWMKKHYTESKMVRMMDQTGRVAYDAISSENIVDDPEIFIEAGSAFRWDARDRDQHVMDLFQAGLIDPETAMKELSFRTGNAFVTEKIQGLSHAKKMLEAASGATRSRSSSQTTSSPCSKSSPTSSSTTTSSTDCRKSDSSTFETSSSPSRTHRSPTRSSSRPRPCRRSSPANQAHAATQTTSSETSSQQAPQPRRGRCQRSPSIAPTKLASWNRPSPHRRLGQRRSLARSSEVSDDPDRGYHQVQAVHR